jgi:hypothetical protein
MKRLACIPGLTGFLLFCLAPGTTWAEEAYADPEPASNIEGWYEEEDQEGENPWTWFGMGYENRMSLSNGTNSGAGSGGAGAAGPGAGGPARIMKQSAAGRR